MDIGDKIKQIISGSIDMKHFEVKDFTGRHLNHEQHNGCLLYTSPSPRD